MLIVFYVSGHGLGHASRDVELMNRIAARDQSVRFVVRTVLPRHVFARGPAPIDVQPLETDTGLTQIDSLRFDEIETAVRAAAFYRDFDRRIEEEAAVLRAQDADLVIGDIPPLAFAAAARANVTSVAFANFTWDWIYGAYAAFDTYAPHVLPVIRRAYAQATFALRLPFHGGFAPMAAVVRDVPLVARRSRRDPRETRQLLGISGDRPVVLTSFGAYGAPIPFDAVADDDTFTLLTVEPHLPQGLAYEDLVAAADVVVSKPGYGIVSECIANDTALLYTSRGRFVEYDRFVEEMPRMLRCRYISQEALFCGQWSDAIIALVAQPAPPERPRVDGATVAAAAIVGWLRVQ